MLPVFFEVARRLPQHPFALAAMLVFPSEFYTAFDPPGNVSIYTDATYDLLRQARAALVTSGTATLETALLGVPQLVTYRTGAFNFWLAKKLVEIDYISLVNLIAERPPVVPEYLQVTSEQVDDLANALKPLLDTASPERRAMLAGYADLQVRVGDSGASHRAAEWIHRDCRSLPIDKNQPSN